MSDPLVPQTLAHPYAWVEQTVTVDAISGDERKAYEANPGWKLIGVGKGSHEQTTLTFGWPWPGGVS